MDGPRADAAAAPDIARLLSRHQSKDILRFLTCGSVDDGKSTLIGRLLYDTKLIFEDQLASLRKDSRKHGTTGGDIDFALLVDGLEAEREQGITIDVAYRFFATPKRKFIVADTPGHEQYTRNMATGASTADLAVILVDARKGILAQTRRHAFIASLLGIRQVVLAVNKIDLVNYSQAVFDSIARDFAAFSAGLSFAAPVVIPVSARYGDNLFARSAGTPWYAGPTLVAHLESVETGAAAAQAPFRMPVQWVNRPDLDFRGYSGTVAAGRIAVGDPVVAAGSAQTSRVARIVTFDGERQAAEAGEAVTLTLADEIDISRGDVLAAAEAPPAVADQLAAHLIWMHADPLIPGRSYLLKLGARTLPASVTEIKHRIDVNTSSKLAARTLAVNEVGAVNLSLSHPVAFAPYRENRALGGFIVIDRLSNLTVGAGTVDFALRRAANVPWQRLAVDKGVRAGLKGQRPAVVWLTGLPGAGKSTVANLVESRLAGMGRHTALLDGDNIRHGLSRDLGFTEADRVENIRRAAEVARLMVDAGLLVLASFISPFRAERRLARALFAPGEFIEVHVDAPLSVAEARDPKGLYAQARAGLIPNFTGIGSPYEPPEAPELVLDTAADAAEACAEAVITLLREGGYLD